LLNQGLADASLSAEGQATAEHMPFHTPEPAALAGLFPQLQILELLGRGGMGAVYKARQPGLDRLVALKVVPIGVGLDPAFGERFAREARALARLSHPHIVAVYDCGRVEGLYYVLMEYVDGVDLRRAMRDGALTPEQALAIVPQLCDALQFAHDEGVVHRDIKPENLLLDARGRLKVADFGLAKLLGRADPDARLTAPDQVMGTLHYMAPEQMETPGRVDHRADIYSLGVVFYELLTGRLPLGHFAPPSRTVRVDVRLDEVVLRALEREPRRRYQHASEVKTDLEAIAGRTSPAPAPAPAPHRPAAKARPAAPIPAPLPPGTGPLLLLIAAFMVLSLLAMTAGVVALVYGALTTRLGSNEFWGWAGSALGCILGGGGSLVGCWNSYRQMTGEGDLLWDPGRNWLDRLIGGYGLIGLISLSAGLVLAPWLNGPSAYCLVLFGGMMTVQGGIFLLVRVLLRRAARERAAAPGGLDDGPV
jgi:predicted Ser/Thr protein kinase